MNIYTMQTGNISGIAALMSTIKPDWWDYQGASQQLQDERLLARLVGWYLGEDAESPKGWLLCAEFPGYCYLSIENLGYDAGGTFVMEEPLEPLLRQAEEYARGKGYRNLKYVIGSTGMSCHGRPLGDYAKELAELHSLDREHYDFFYGYGFRPAGFLPNCYGENYHGIIMIKGLAPDSLY